MDIEQVTHDLTMCVIKHKLDTAPRSKAVKNVKALVSTYLSLSETIKSELECQCCVVADPPPEMN